MTAAVEARHRGHCPACEESILIGQLIMRDPLDGAGMTWVHETCPMDRPSRPVCTTCFLEIVANGACGCES